MMGQLARRRARPWLIAASGALLVVGMFVSAIMFWILLNARGSIYDATVARLVGLTDLLIASLIAIAVLLTGQAIVVYEVFTGKTLPRRGLHRYWQRAIILAAGYSSTVGLSLSLSLPPIYSLLLSTVLMVGFYALLSWRSYLEREHFIEQLRPFITSQNLYGQLLNAPKQDETPDTHSPFEALCENILGSRNAVLAPLGPMAPLFGPALSYPQGTEYPIERISEISSSFNDPSMLCYPLSTEDQDDLSWVIPLWNERGLSGALILGGKADQALYTQEEIEIARAAGERLIDIQAGVEMGRRLMSLQRDQMVESQVIDRQTRRVLHDDVLPQLHTCMITLNNMQINSNQQGDELLEALAKIHHQIADLLRDIPATTASDVDRLGLLGALRHLTETELAGTFDQIDWQISPQAHQNSAMIPPLIAQVLFYAVRESMRNAAQHGRDSHNAAALILRVHVAWNNGLEMLIEDNGASLNVSKERHAGSGQGLALHSTLLAVVGGSLSVENVPNESFRIRIRIPYQALQANM